MVHNRYGAPSGEEAEFDRVAHFLEASGSKVRLFQRSSKELDGSIFKKAGAMFSGIYNPFERRRIAGEIDSFAPDLVFLQNLFPLISPAILPVLKARGIPTVMRVANYRLFCPNGLCLSHGSVCERCAGGKEYLVCTKKLRRQPTEEPRICRPECFFSGDEVLP